MRTLKISKYQWVDTIKAVGIFYAVFLAIITLVASANVNSGGRISSSGLEFASIVFLFIVGLNSFKDSFKLSQANNVPRKTYFKGLIIGVFPVALFMSLIDLLINRIYNIFVNCPTIFDMVYGSFRDSGMRDLASGAFVWTQANDILTLLGTAIWQFAAYSIALLLGILISLIYYRCSTLLKVTVSIILVFLLNIIGNLSSIFPTAFCSNLGQITSAAFGWQSRNPYAAVFTLAFLGALLSGFIYLLLKRAVPKE